MKLIKLHNVIYEFLIEGAFEREKVAVQIENMNHATEMVDAIVADQSDDDTEQVIIYLVDHPSNVDRTVHYMRGYWMINFDCDPSGSRVMDNNIVPVHVQEYVERIVDMICSMP